MDVLFHSWDAQTSPPWHIVMPSGGGIHSITSRPASPPDVVPQRSPAARPTKTKTAPDAWADIAGLHSAACVKGRAASRPPAVHSRLAHSLPPEAQAAPGRNVPTRQPLRIRSYGKPLSGTTTSLERRELQRIPVGFGRQGSMAPPTRCV